MKILKLHHIFIILAVSIVVASIYVSGEFKKSKEYVESKYINENVQYIGDLAKNLEKSILEETGEDVYSALKKDVELRKQLESNFELFVTGRYKYIYLLDKLEDGDRHFRFLLDGSIDLEDKSEFGEKYEPLELGKFEELYESKKALYFKHKTIKSLWLTYLYPIVINGKVKSIIVIDFSMDDFELIHDSLQNFDQLSQKMGYLFIFIFFMIVWFSYIDKKKQQELKAESLKIKKLNDTLEDRVKEEILKRAEQEQILIQQSRFAAMGEMIGNIAHQWRQPLNALGLLMQNIEIAYENKMLDDAYMQRAVSKSNKLTQSMSQTIDDFRNFFEPNKNSEIFFFDKAYDSTIDLIGSSLSNNSIELQKNIDETVCTDGFPSEFSQVLLNILNNAKDALITNKESGRLIKVNLYRENGYAYLSIEDNAGGVQEEIIHKIFDPYFTTKEEGKGTGIGLYMSKMIIENNMNGTLSVKNNSDGACFIIKMKICSCEKMKNLL